MSFQLHNPGREADDIFISNINHMLKGENVSLFQEP